MGWLRRFFVFCTGAARWLQLKAPCEPRPSAYALWMQSSQIRRGLSRQKAPDSCASGATDAGKGGLHGKSYWKKPTNLAICTDTSGQKEANDWIFVKQGSENREQTSERQGPGPDRSPPTLWIISLFIRLDYLSVLRASNPALRLHDPMQGVW